jgi:hypothetical protein
MEQLLIWGVHQILNKNSEYNRTVHNLFIDFKKAYDVISKAVLYKIPLEFGIRN